MPDQDFIQMLQAAPNLMNMADDYDRTLLLYSILKSEKNKMNSLLLEGANAKVTDKAGNTALHYAAVHANPHTVNELTRRQASTKAVNNAGKTPLH